MTPKAEPGQVADRRAGRFVEPADGLLLLGCVLAGTMLTGPFGAIPLVVALLRLRRAVRAGEGVRTWSATVIGTFCLVDGMINFLPWTLDTFAHGTTIGRTFMTGYGRFFDGAFYIGYNSTALGGVADPTEKMWQLMAISIVMPMRIVSAWAFLQLRTWGLHFMKVSGWLYLLLWAGYTTAMTMNADGRMATSQFGLGWWLFNLFYLSPFVLLPYLYTARSQEWNR